MDLTQGELNRCIAYTEALLLMHSLLPRDLVAHLEAFKRDLRQEYDDRRELVNRALATPRDFTEHRTLPQRSQPNSGAG